MIASAKLPRYGRHRCPFAKAKASFSITPRTKQPRLQHVARAQAGVWSLDIFPNSWSMCPNSPPGLGGVAAPPRKCSRSLLAQTGWSGLARSHLIDTRVALLIQSVRFANIIRSLRIMDRPPRRSLANGTPPNLLIITHKSSAGQRRLGQPEGKAKSPPWTRRGGRAIQ